MQIPHPHHLFTDIFHCNLKIIDRPMKREKLMIKVELIVKKADCYKERKKNMSEWREKCINISIQKTTNMNNSISVPIIHMKN